MAQDRRRRSWIGHAVIVAAFALSGTASASTTARDGPTDVGPLHQAAAPDATVPARLRTVIAKTLKVQESKVTASATFVKDLGADELALVELVMAYEKEFKVDITNAEAEGFKQVRDVVAFLRKRGVLQ